MKKLFYTAIALAVVGLTTYSAFAASFVSITSPHSISIGSVSQEMRQARAEDPVEEGMRVAERVAATPQKIVITEDYGGAVFDYITKYNEYRREGTKIRVDDYCLSACTILAGLVDPENVCVSEYAVFGFHSAYNGYTGEYHREATRLIWNIYPHKLQDELRRRGWDGDSDKPHPEFLYIKGTELYPLCKD